MQPATRMEMIAMLVPTRRPKSLINNLMLDPFETFLDNATALAKPAPTLMKTDIKETDAGFELAIDMPGFEKDDVVAELKDGYLSVSAQTSSEHEEKDEEGTFIRKERFSGKCSRSFYVGDDISEDDIKAKFENGLLKITVPKKEQPQEEEARKVIAIEG